MFDAVIFFIFLGSGRASATTGKATPIPLGPSSASPNAQQYPRSRKPSPLSAPVNNAVSENDDDYYLQRSDTSDSKLQHDLLRGSSSGNFFSNKNRGIENSDDYDDTARVQASSKDAPKKNTKAPFRKLLTSKKPFVESSTTGAPSTAEAQRQWTGSTTTTTSTTTARQPNYKATTYRSKDRGRVNYKTYLDKQTQVDEYDSQKIAKPVVNPQTTTFASVVGNSYQTTTAKFNQNRVQQYQTTVQADNNVQQVAFVQPKNNDYLRTAPVNRNNDFKSARINNVPPTNNNNNNNNNFQPNNNVFPQNNQGFQQPDANGGVSKDFQQQNYNQQGFQSDKIFPTTTPKIVNPGNNFQSEKIVTTATPQNFNQNPTTTVYQTNAFQQLQQGNNAFQAGNAFQTGYTFQPANNAFQTGNTFQPVNNAFQTGNTFQPGNTFQTGNTFPQQQGNTFQIAESSTTQKYNTYQTSSPTAYQQSTNVFQSSTPYNTGNTFQQQQQQQTQQQQQQQSTQQQPQYLQSTTEHFSKDFKAKFDPYNSYHQRSNEEAGELLKTAPSTNLRPSELNALIQPRPKSINATLSVGFSFNKADGGVAKSTVIVPAPTTQKPRPFTTTPVATSSAATSTAAYVSSSSAATTAGAKKAIFKDKDSSYDYAYYDDSNHNDYTDVVSEEFSRLHGAN